MPATTPTPPPSIGNAVTAAIRSGTYGDRDRAAIALAKRYAYELDTAYAAEAEFEEIRKDGEQSMWRRLDLLERRVRAGTVVADVGPKLLAVLGALGLTPEAALKFVKVPPAQAPADGTVVTTPQMVLAALQAESDELAARRATRAST